MRRRADGTTTAGTTGVRRHTLRWRALVLAVVMALSVAVIPTSCGGPSDGPRPSGGVPSY